MINKQGLTSIAPYKCVGTSRGTTETNTMSAEGLLLAQKPSGVCPL